MVQAKQPKEMHFKPLEEAIKFPSFHPWDDARADWATQLHHLWRALHLFELDVSHSFATATPRRIDSHVYLGGSSANTGR